MAQPPLLYHLYQEGIASGAHIAQNPGAAAVLHILKLNHQAVRIREIQFRRAFLCAAAIFHTHIDVVDQWAGRALRGSSRFDAVTFERLDDVVRLEIVDSHAEVVDAAGTRSGIRDAAGEHEKLNAITDAHHRRRRSLIGLDPKTEKLLIKLVRAS